MWSNVLRRASSGEAAEPQLGLLIAWLRTRADALPPDGPYGGAPQTRPSGPVGKPRQNHWSGRTAVPHARSTTRTAPFTKASRGPSTAPSQSVWPAVNAPRVSGLWECVRPFRACLAGREDGDASALKTAVRRGRCPKCHAQFKRDRALAACGCCPQWVAWSAHLGMRRARPPAIRAASATGLNYSRIAHRTCQRKWSSPSPAR